MGGAEPVSSWSSTQLKAFLGLIVIVLTTQCSHDNLSLFGANGGSGPSMDGPLPTDGLPYIKATSQVQLN